MPNLKLFSFIPNMKNGEYVVRLGYTAALAPGENVAQEHWCSSGFANTDLDVLLKNHGVQKLIVIGLIAHTCIEATVRFAAELDMKSLS